LKKISIAALIAATAACAANTASAQGTERIATLTVENDLFVGEDNGYTNGTYFSWAHGGLSEFNDENLPDWIHAISRNLYISTMSGKRRGVSYLVGQAMQTPADITQPELIEDDVPYVGLLLWQGSLHAYDDHLADKLSLAWGIAGPAAGAKHTQTTLHQWVGADEPMGWGHQINNELAFRVGAERLWRIVRFTLAEQTGFDMIGIGSAGVGTLKSNVAAGLSFRFGYGLDRSFPTATVLPGREINPLAGSVAHSWSLFFNVLGEYVANDISIDGNTFSDSHAVKLEHWQNQFVAGLAFNWERWAFLLSNVKASERHEQQIEPGDFGSLSVTYHF